MTTHESGHCLFEFNDKGTMIIVKLRPGKVRPYRISQIRLLPHETTEFLVWLDKNRKEIEKALTDGVGKAITPV